MAWVSGVFTGQGGTSEHANREAASQGITSTILDSDRNELVAGINACLTKDGSNAPTGPINIGNNRITGVAPGTARTDAPNIGQIQDGVLLNGGSSGGSANAQTIALSPPITAYVDCMRVRFRAGASTTIGNPTLNINGVGARTIYRPFGQSLEFSDILSGQWHDVIFDGVLSGFLLQNPLCGWNAWTPTITASAGSLSATSASGIYCRIPNGLVSFTLTFTTTLSGASAQFYFTVPLPATDLNPVFSGFLGSGGVNFVMVDASRALCLTVVTAGTYASVRASGSYKS